MRPNTTPNSPTIARSLVVTALALLTIGPASEQPAGAEDNYLRPVESFDSIEKRKARSRALFLEAARVLTHPRCVNCHPAGDRPLQGEAAELHQPPVERGPYAHGFVGMKCRTCHQEVNVDWAELPGAPNWHLAPRSMAWEGLSVAELCEQLKDRRRNGNRDLDAVVRHMTHDSLVLWGWNPGAGREPVPGTPESFGALITAWAKTGAACPEGPATASAPGRPR